MATLRHNKNRLLILFICSFITIFHKNSSQSEIDIFFPELRFNKSPKAFSRRFYKDLIELGIYGKQNYVNLTAPLPKVTFVTAISNSHIYEGRAMVMELSLTFLGHKIILYDMGMEPFLRVWFERACNVEVRDIDLKRYEVDDDLMTYRWKPIVIATALKEFPIVFYVDTSTAVRQNATTMKDFLANIPIKPGEPNIYTIGRIDHSVYATTNPGIYDYLKPRIDLNSTMLEAGKVIYIRTKETYELGLKWYVLCALEKNCMAPKNHTRQCNFTKERYNDYVNCHRYDQSTLNLIMASYPNFNQADWGLKSFYTNYGQFGSDYWKPVCEYEYRPFKKSPKMTYLL